MGEWKEVKLGDFLNVKHGYAFKGKNITPEETENILVTPGNFHIGGGFKSNKFKYFNGDHPKEYILKEGDVVITMTDLSKATDTLGYSAKIPFSKNKKYLHNQRIGLVEFINEDADKNFIYWLLRTREYQWYIVGSASGTSIMHTSPSRIKDYEFRLPPLKVQRPIANILTNLDDKIDLLHRQNKTLEAMAETLFRQWFVEEANEEMELLDFIEINPRESLKKGIEAPYLEMKNVQSESANPSNWYYREFKSGTKFKNGDTVMARITPCLQNGKKAFIQFLAENEIAWGSTEFLVFRTKETFHPFMSYLLAKNEKFKSFAVKTMTGSSGRQRVQTDSLKQFNLNKPNEEKITELNIYFEKVSMKLKLNASQIQTLATLRDTLLPKLMNGTVTITTNG